MNPKAFSGSVIVLDKADKELGTFPLTVARDGATLEAKIPPALGALPLKAAAKVKFAPELREQRFDFNFAEFSKDTAAPATPPAAPAPKPATTTANTPAPARPAAAKPAPPTAAAKPAPAPAAPTSSTRACITGTADSRQPDADSAGARRGARRIEAADEYTGAAR